MKVENTMTSLVLDKLHKGELISDKELVTAIETLEPIVDFLKECGQIYFLPAKFLNGKLEQLKSFREARKV